jgi:hypothetical protein
MITRTLLAVLVLTTSASAQPTGLTSITGTATSSTMTFPTSTRYLFTPQLDITTYELARITPLLVQPGMVTPEVFNALAPDVRRHFTEIK